MRIPHFFRSIFILLLWLALQYAIGLLYGQSSIRLHGYVSDASNGEPVAGAIIQVVNSAFMEISKEDGYFTIENLPPGTYDISVSHLGYQSIELNRIVITADQPRRILIKLLQDPLQSDSVYVFATAVNPATDMDGEKIILTGDKIEQLKKLGLPGVLQQVAGLQIQTGNGGAGNMIIRIHGGSGSQVLILLDGQRLNNPQTGEVDLNLLPLELIDKIEITPHGNTAVYGNNAFDGIINFKTRKTSERAGGDIKSYLGSFSTAGGDVTLNFDISGVEFLTNYHQDYSEQNFQYQHEGEKFTRENAWTRNQKFFSKLTYRHTANELNMLLNYSQGQQGLPSSFYEEMLHHDAWSNFKFTTFQLNDRWLINNTFFVRTLLGYHKLDQFFNNGQDPSPFTRYKSRQKNNLYEAKSEVFYQLHPSVSSRMGVNVLREQLESENLLYPQYSIGNRNRNTFSIYGSSEWSFSFLARILKANNWRAAARYEKYFNLPAKIYPFFGFSITPYYLSFISISGSWARAIRYPDFNSLFWKGDARSRGNPDLLPERKDQWNISLRTTWSNPLISSLSVYYFSENIEDLIFWHRNVQGIWEPRNEQKVHKQGLDFQLDQILIRQHLQWKLSYSYIDALNKSDEPNRYDKQIVFVPQHSLSSSIQGQLKAIQLLLLYRYVSERHVTAANTGIPLHSYNVWDILASYDWIIGEFKLELGGALKNLSGTNYELIRGYPMPGREFQLSLALKYHSN